MDTSSDKDSENSASYNIEQPAYFDEIPLAHEKHPVNYVQYFCEILARYRRSLPGREKSQSHFGNVLGRYFGSPVDRGRIGRVEQGDVTVSFGVIAAYLTEMGAWPKVINALESGDSTNLRYLLLIEDSLKEEIFMATNSSQEKLRNERSKV
jgi:hypothetical protein